MVFVPGMNLLNMALTVIQRQTITYYQYTGRSLNAIGQDVTTYAAPVDIVGSWQPIPRNLYEQFGLDLQKDYFNFYSSNNLLDVTRDVSGDQLVFMTKSYQVESATDWYQLDGWKGIICVDLGVDEDG